MERATHARLVDRLRSGELMRSPPFEVDAARYASAEQLAEERGLFARPRIIAASSQIGRGEVMPYDEPGRGLVLARDAEGTLRGFRNACRHRATRLVDARCAAKAMTCAYHGWSYDLTGALLHAPHAETFGGACAQRDLVPVEIAERCGLVWLGGEPELGALEGDLDALGLADHAVFRTSTCTRACNWKLIVEAFLDGYHIRVLHRDSIYRFFLDAMSVAEPVGDHIRAVSGRRALRDAPADLAGVDLRTLATPSFLVFPATVIIAHPDFVSIIALAPLAPDATQWRHTMLIPAARARDTAHWEKSWELIEGGVFQREDLWVCEQIQRGIAGGSGPLLYGALELPIAWFNDSIDASIKPR